MEVSVIIVSYNVKTYLVECIQSVLNALQHTHGEMIVIDNNSSDNTVEELQPLFKSVKFIASKENLGFAKANNLAVKSAKGKHVLILNPDTFVPEDLFKKILPFAKSKDKLGALGVQLIDGDGKFHPECKRNIPTLKNTFDKNFGFLFGSKENSYYNTKLQPNENGESEVLVGAFMLLPKSVYEEVNGFDEAYFMYGEDIDLCFKLRKKGYKNYYFGSATVVHYKGKSTKKDHKYLSIFYGAMHIFINKHYKNSVLNPLLHFAVWFRHQLTKYVLPQKVEHLPNPNWKEFYEHIPNAEIPEDAKFIVLDAEQLTNKEMINVIQKNRQPERHFYMKSKQQNYLIGNHTTVEIKKSSFVKFA